MKQALANDFWVHLGGLLAIAIGVFDLWQTRQLGQSADLIFVIGGLAALGVKLTNAVADRGR